ncbi:kinesin-like protein KIF27 [Orbicella faveolata]|uniref:kinesin-like protein KIF27 n=1 Tax=Orbicella faveolata TaxID=48498 RepID=UPI0009E38024|nr:kinesin-like protein KIF27 [Orbicella faveolata]
MGEVPVKVAVRVRPLVGQEKVHNVPQCVHFIPDKPQLILGKDRGFTFDYVFPPKTTQADVYDKCVEPLVKSCMEGYNATVFAYGQTSSGKTYTIGGTNSAGLLEEEYGIILRAVKQLFQIMEENKHKTAFVVTVSYIEIYMEELRDLLDVDTSSKDIYVREDDKGNTVIVGATEQPVHTADEVMSCLDSGSAGRQVGTTNMNEHSSRSHTIFTLYIEQKPLIEEEQVDDFTDYKYAKFHFVDLAGSERAHRTGNVGERFKESVFINSGLLSLGNVISALADSKKKVIHVPYRDSKVTRLLKDSLGGNSRTLMITCLSPCAADFAENLNSLKYATRARNIRNKPIVNRDPQNTRLAEMQNEIQALREELQRRRGSSVGSGGTVEDAERIKSLEDELERSRGACDTYKQLIVDALSQLKALHKAGVMSNNQANQFDRLVKAVEQVKSRPIWTPNTARQQQADLVEHLKKELNKYKEDLSSDEEIFAEKTKEIESLKENVRKLEEEKAKLINQLQETQTRLKKHEDQLFQQQLQLNQLLLYQGISPVDKMVLSSPRGTRVLTAPLVQDGTGPENDREVHSSPPVFVVDRIIQDFRARSQLLVSQHEEEDEVVCTLSDTSESEDEADEEPSRALGKTWNIKRDGPKIPHVPAIPRQQNTSKNLSHAKTKVPAIEVVESKDKGSKPDTAERNEVEALRSSTQVMGKEVKQVELRLHSAEQKLRDLNINIRQKEELIKELAKSDKEAKETKKQFSEKVKSMKQELEKAKKELEDSKKTLEEYESKANYEVSEKQKVEAEYKKKLQTVETKLQALKRKQKDNEKISALHEEREKKVQELEVHIDRMRNQQDQLHKKLKEEADRKIKMERDMQKQQQKIKELEDHMNQQQKVLKRKTEEVAAAQRRLRNVGKHGSEEKESDEQAKLDQRRQWLDNEVEKVLRRKEAMETLAEELKKREAIVLNKEALLAEKSELEIKKLRSSQVLSKDILRLSSQLGEVEKQIKQKGKNVDETDAPNPTKVEESIHSLERTKDELLKQRELLEQKLQEGSLLDPKEERRLIELDEGIDALEAAIEFKNEGIANKQKELDSGQLLTDKDREGLVNKLSNLSPGEATSLLSKYFEKVVELRGNEKKLELRCSDQEVRINEQERIIGELGRGLQQAEMKGDRRLVEYQKKYEQRIQFLMNKLRDAESNEAPDQRIIELENRTQQLEKDLYYYKKTSRELKKKLREKMASGMGTSLESDVIAASGELEAQYKSSDAHGKQLVTEVKRMKHSLAEKGIGVPSQASTPVRVSRKDLRQMSSQEVSLRRSQTSVASTVPELPGLSDRHNLVEESPDDLVQDSIEQNKNPWA